MLRCYRFRATERKRSCNAGYRSVQHSVPFKWKKLFRRLIERCDHFACEVPSSRARFVYSLKTIFSSLCGLPLTVCFVKVARYLLPSDRSLSPSCRSLSPSGLSLSPSFGSLAISFLRVSHYLLPSGRSLSPSFGSLADRCLLRVVRCLISFDVSLLHCIFSSLLWYPLCLVCYLFTPSKCTVTKRNGVLPFYRSKERSKCETETVRQWNGNGKYRCTETERQRNGNFSMPPTVYL